jgi:hypothetical protein
MLRPTPRGGPEDSKALAIDAPDVSDSELAHELAEGPRQVPQLLRRLRGPDDAEVPPYGCPPGVQPAAACSRAGPEPTRRGTSRLAARPTPRRSCGPRSRRCSSGKHWGLGHDPGQHVAYIDSWIKVLEEDSLELFRAAAAAEKISAYVLAWDLQLKAERDVERAEARHKEAQRGASEGLWAHLAKSAGSSPPAGHTRHVEPGPSGRPGALPPPSRQRGRSDTSAPCSS